MNRFLSVCIGRAADDGLQGLDPGLIRGNDLDWAYLRRNQAGAAGFDPDTCQRIDVNQRRTIRTADRHATRYQHQDVLSADEGRYMV